MSKSIRNYRKITFGTTNSWSMGHSFRRTSKPAYYIVDCRIFGVEGSFGWRENGFYLDLLEAKMHTVTIFNAKILTTDLTSSCPCCQLGKIAQFWHTSKPNSTGFPISKLFALSFYTFGKNLVHVRILKFFSCWFPKL